MVEPRLAKSLVVLRDQVNATWPNRSKVSDGWIAGAEHTQANPDSDHEMDEFGRVTAFDFTHDLRNGPDTWKLADILRMNRDPRIKYVISNGRIFSSTVSPWQWRKYTGRNNHAKHVHVSVLKERADQLGPWDLDVTGELTPQPPRPSQSGITADMRRRMMEAILAYEGRFDGGKLKVFVAPDGNPEIGGVTRVSHPEAYASLKELLDAGDQTGLKKAVLAYYDSYTDAAEVWTPKAGVEFYLRDCILNRGPRGAAEILQDAVGVEVDGEVGPTTRKALAALDSMVAIDKLRAARERYEIRVYTKEARVAKGQWIGLVNRWNKAQAQAKAFQNEQNTAGLEAVVTTTIVVGGGGVAAAVSESPFDFAMAVFTIAIFALAAFLIVRKIRRSK